MPAKFEFTAFKLTAVVDRSHDSRASAATTVEVNSGGCHLHEGKMSLTLRESITGNRSSGGLSLGTPTPRASIPAQTSDEERKGVDLGGQQSMGKISSLAENATVLPANSEEMARLERSEAEDSSAPIFPSSFTSSSTEATSLFEQQQQRQRALISCPAGKRQLPHSSMSIVRSGSGREITTRLARTRKLQSCLSQLISLQGGMLPEEGSVADSLSNLPLPLTMIDLEMAMLSSPSSSGVGGGDGTMGLDAMLNTAVHASTSSGSFAAIASPKSKSQTTQCLQLASLVSKLREVARSFLEEEDLALARTSEQRNALLDELIATLTRLRYSTDEPTESNHFPNAGQRQELRGNEGNNESFSANAAPVAVSFSNKKHSCSLDFKQLEKLTPPSKSSKESANTSATSQLRYSKQMLMHRPYKSLERAETHEVDVGRGMRCTRYRRLETGGAPLRESLTMLLELKRESLLSNSNSLISSATNEKLASIKTPSEEGEVIFL